MITTFFLTILYGLVNSLVGILPIGHLPASISSAFAYFIGLVNTYNYIVPLATLLAASLVVLFFDGILLLWHIINWIIRKIPGMN